MKEKDLSQSKGRLKLGGKIFLLVFWCFLLCFPPSAYAVPSSDSLLGYWKMDNNLYDYSGHNNNGAMTGTSSPSFVLDAPSTFFPNHQSLVFPDTSTNFSITPVPLLQPTTAFTFSFWVNFYQAPVPTTWILGGNYTYGQPKGFQIKVDSSQMTLEVGDGSTTHSTAFSSSQFAASTWMLVTATWNGANLKLYLNGVNKSSTTYSGVIGYGSSQFQLGHFQGKIDDVRLYNRALSDTEITDLAAGRHTSATWTGSFDSNYEEPYNWNTAAVPDPYTIAIIPSTATQPQFTAGESLAGLTIGTGAQLDLKSSDLTINDSGAFINNGTLLLSNNNNQIISNLTNDTDSGTVVMSYTAATNGLRTGARYYNLTINNSTNTYVNLDSDISVLGNLKLQSGTLSAGAYNIGLKGDWLVSNGSFAPGTGTVNLIGGDQTIYGSNTFYNLTKTSTSWDRLGFESGTTQTITNDVTLSGTPWLNLRSTNPGVQWKIDPQKTRTFSHIDVRDSNNINNIPISATSSDFYNSGNNTNWTFDTTPSDMSAVSADAGSSSAKITWTTAENTSSSVEYGESSSYGKTTTETDTNPRVTSHSVTLTGLDSCTTFHYRVRSKDTADNETISNDATFKTDGCCESPGTPKIEEVVARDTSSITLSFKKADGTVDHYALKYGTKSGTYQWENSDIGNKDTDKYTVKSLSSNTTYYFKIRAVNDCSKGDWSNEESAKTKEETATATAGTNVTTTSSSISTTEPQASPRVTTTPTTVPTAQPNFNGETSMEWQEHYFGNAYCYDEGRCGMNADPDSDGVSNIEEFRLGTDPTKTDSDNDGMNDGAELEAKHNPLQPSNGQSSDQVQFESPKEKGQISKNIEVKEVKMISSGGKKKLEISGKGPPNSYVTVYIYSSIPTILTIKTASDGSWSYTLDKDIGDGDHQVYVATTDSNGRITAKSEPLNFVKTAEAVTVIPPAQASGSASSPVEKRSFSSMFYFILIGFAAIIIAVLGIGLVLRKKKKNDTLPIT